MPHTPVFPLPQRAQAWQAIPARIGVVLVAVLAAGVALGPYAQAAAPCHVPGDYATIQAAVVTPPAPPSRLRPDSIRKTSGSLGRSRFVATARSRTVIDGEGGSRVGGDDRQRQSHDPRGDDSGRCRRMARRRPLQINGHAHRSRTAPSPRPNTIRATRRSNGGGIENEVGTLTVWNSTVSDNTADFAGGGLQTCRHAHRPEQHRLRQHGRRGRRPLQQRAR